MTWDKCEPTVLQDDELDEVIGGLLSGTSGTGKTMTADLLGKYSGLSRSDDPGIAADGEF